MHNGLNALNIFVLQLALDMQLHDYKVFHYLQRHIYIGLYIQVSYFYTGMVS